MSAKSLVRTAFACTSCGVPLAVEDRDSAKVLAGVLAGVAGNAESFVLIDEGQRKKGEQGSGVADAGAVGRRGQEGKRKDVDQDGRDRHHQQQQQAVQKGHAGAMNELSQEELNNRVALFKASESYASGRAQVKHPLCEDCTEMTLRELERDHDKAMSEHSKYASFLEELERESAEDLKAKAAGGVGGEGASAAAVAAEEEKRLIAEVQALEAEVRQVRSERLRVAATARALDGEEQRM